MMTAAEVEGPGASMLIIVGAVVIRSLARRMRGMSFRGLVPEILDTFDEPWNQQDCEDEGCTADGEMRYVNHRISS